MNPKVPESLKLEHEELHAELARATKAGGKTGEAAKAVAGVLHNHFLKEEEFALPPIGLLAALARGEVDEEMRDVLVMTERLKAELPEMLREHQAVVAALEQLTAAAEERKTTGACALCGKVDAARANGGGGSLSRRYFGRRVS